MKAPESFEGRDILALCAMCYQKLRELIAEAEHALRFTSLSKEEWAMRSKLLAIVILITGFLLAVLGLAWATTLFFQGELRVRIGPVTIIMHAYLQSKKSIFEHSEAFLQFITYGILLNKS